MLHIRYVATRAQIPHTLGFDERKYEQLCFIFLVLNLIELFVSDLVFFNEV